MRWSWHLLSRPLSRFRRPLAALLAGIAVFATINAFARPEGDEAWAVVTTHAVAGGDVIAPDDVTLAQLPRRALPERFVTDPAEVLERRLTIGLPSGAVLLESAVVTPHGLANPGMAVVPVTIGASAAGLIRVGDQIDLFASSDSSPPTLVASQARVVAILSAAASGGLLRGSSAADGVGLLVETAPTAASQLVAQSGGSPLGFALR